MAIMTPAAAVPGLGALMARQATGSLNLGGFDILAGLPSQSVVSFSYTDNTSDQADDLTVEIADPTRTWMQTYLPKKGVECQAKINLFNWTAPGDTRIFDCGTFWFDELTFNGPPNTVSIKATSIPTKTGIKNTKKFRSWEGVPLQAIASQIAGEHGLSLIWQTAKSAMSILKRIDQCDTPDLEFIRDRVKDASLSLKIFNRQLIVYSEEEYEARGSAFKLLYGMSQILNYSFSSKLNDTYKSAKNAYVSPDTGQLIETPFDAPEPPEGTDAVEEINEGVQDDGEGGGGGAGAMSRSTGAFVGFSNAGGSASQQSLEKTKAKLRAKNKLEKHADIIVLGNTDYLSGLNIDLLGFGIFDGKWFIESSVHDISGNGYTTSLKLRGALNGY